MSTSVLASMSVVLNGEISHFKRAMAQAKKEMRDVVKVGESMKDVGKSMSMYLTAPLAGVAAAATMLTANFDDSMSKVSALSGATGNDLDSLRQLAKKMGSETAHSASAAADAMSYLALAGYDTNQILESTPSMLSLASAASMDLATAADIVTDTMSAFKMQASQAGAAADIFATAQAKSNTNVQQLGEAMKYAAPIASAFEQDLAQTAAVLGVFADSGIKGSMGGTTFAAVLDDLKGAAKNGAVQVGKMKVSLYDAAGSARPFADIMRDVEQATDGMSTAQRDAALSAIFSGRSIKGANIILATGTKRLYELEEQLRNSEGAAKKMAETMEDNLGGAMRALRSAAEGAAISIGEVLAPTLQKVAAGLSAALRWFQNLSPAVKTVVTIVAALVAAIGPLLVVVGSLLTALPMLSAAFALLTGPIGLTVAAIVAAVALIIANWDTLKAYFTSGAGGEIFEKLKTVATKAFNAIKAVMERFVKIATGLWETFGKSILNVAKVFWDNISAVFKVALNTMGYLLDAFRALAEGNWSGLWQSFKNIAATVINGIIDLVSNFALSLPRLLNASLKGLGVDNKFTRGLDAALTHTKKLIDGIKMSTKEVYEEVANVPVPAAAAATTTTTPGKTGGGGGSVGDTAGLEKQRDILAALKKDFNDAAKQFEVFGSSFDVIGSKAKLLEGAIVSLLQNGLSPQNSTIKELKSQLDSLNTLDLSPLESSFDQIGQGIERFKEKITLLPAQTGESLAQTAEITVEYGGMIASALQNTFSLVGETIGAALSGNTEGFKGFFNGILLIVADFASAFGSALVAAGVAALAFETLLANPFAAIAAGAALMVAAGVVKGIISKGPGKGAAPKMPSGGSGGSPHPNASAISQPQGEKEITLRVKGHDLVASIKANQYYANRIG
jgi:TP901 family phage tail tape measure protein